MNIQKFSLIVLFALCSVGLAPAAQNDTSPARTTEEPTVRIDHLSLRLEPLTQAELGVEAEAWRGLLKETVQELAEVNIASLLVAEAESEGATKSTTVDAANDKIGDRLESLQQTKAALLLRFDTVLEAFEKKGGDSTELKAYATAVSGVIQEGSSIQANLAAASGWLAAEDGGVKVAKAGVKFFAIICLFWMFGGILAGLTRKMINRHQGFSDLLKSFINKLIGRVILFFGLLVALSSIGVNIGALLALMGGGAFIVGFALQDTLGNFAAGLMVLLYRPFDVGDIVEVGGVSGTVDSVSLVSTTIRTFDNKVVLVPNKSVWGQVITNSTASTRRRVDLVFGIGYSDDIGQAQQILEQIVAGHAQVLKEPAPVVKLHELADSSVNFVCRPWVNTADYWTVYWDVTRQVKEEFDDNGISIPFPQQDVHLHRVES